MSARATLVVPTLVLALVFARSAAAQPAFDVALEGCGELDREGLALVPGADLVTASALLDLVTHEWLERLVAACRAGGSGALLALTWDGTMTWDDPDPDDALVAEAVRSHQLRDKGMGPALGPAAGPAAERARKPVYPHQEVFVHLRQGISNDRVSFCFLAY
mgnify:CR=1 FL=1